MHVELHYHMASDRLELCGHVASSDRVARVCFAVLSRISQIWNNRRHARCAGIPERADEEKQAAQLVIAALRLIGIQGMHHVDIASALAGQRACLMLAVFELSFLVRTQGDADLPAYLF